MVFVYHYPSPVGVLTLVATDHKLSHLLLDNDPDLATFTPCPKSEEVPQVMRETTAYLDAYFNKRTLPPRPRLNLEGTLFEIEVWNELLKVNYGETITYGDIAKVIAKKRGIAKMSAQAVGQAVGHNKLAILIPCHRVVAAGHGLGGYSGGLSKKKFLLSLEGHNLDAFKARFP